MAEHSFQKKLTAKLYAKRARKKGLKVSIYKKKKGWGASATR